MVTKRGQVVGIRGQSIEEVYFRRVRCKLATVSNDSAHPLYSDVGSSRLEGSGRLRVPLEGTNPLKISFTPSAVSMCVCACVHVCGESVRACERVVWCVCVCVVCVCVCVC